MTALTKNCLSILTFIVFFVIALSSSPKNGAFKDAQTWIPRDFNPNNTILLIQTHPENKKQNEKMIEYLKKNYPYRYEVVEKSVIESKSDKYSDTKIYQFGVLWDIKYTQRARTDPTGKVSYATELDLYGNFIDRSTSKIYPTTDRGNVYGRTGYIPFFNSIKEQFK